MRYDIMVTGDWDARATELFDDVNITRAGSATVLSAELDQAALHGLLQRIRVCGLVLLDVRRRRSVRSARPGGGPPA